MKPSLFIGSSVEQLELAYAVQEELEHTVEATVWTQGGFELSRSTMANLLDIVNEADFGLFILAPDDITQLRSKELRTVRDNVVFELGLFIGRLGAERSFLILPSGTDLHLPTDLLGITPATFDPDRQDRNLRAALGPACNRVRRVVQKLGSFNPPFVTSNETENKDNKNNEITDEGDILSVIQSWMGNRPTTSNISVIKFADVDQELNLSSGSAKKYLSVVAERWNYRVARQGEQTILFEKIPSPSGYF